MDPLTAVAAGKICRIYIRHVQLEWNDSSWLVSCTPVRCSCAMIRRQRQRQRVQRKPLETGMQAQSSMPPRQFRGAHYSNHTDSKISTPTPAPSIPTRPLAPHHHSL
jgi:hypothetical protein